MELTTSVALQKGINAHNSGRLEEADKFYTAILAVQPEHPDANHNMGVLAVGLGRIEESLPFFCLALKVNPTIAQFWLSYLDALIKLGQLAKANLKFNEACKIGFVGEAFDRIEKRIAATYTGISETPKSLNPPPDKLAVLFELVNQGRFSQAVEKASLMLAEFPHSSVLYGFQGISNHGLKKFEAAIESFTMVIQITPNDPEAYNNRGCAFRDIGRLDEAIDDYKQAIKIKPDYAVAYSNMGNALRDRLNFNAAIDSYVKAIKLNSDYAEAHNHMGLALSDKGNQDEAIDSYKKAIKIKPKFADAYNNMGLAQMQKGDLEVAMNSYMQALNLRPDFSEAYQNIGRALGSGIFSKPNIKMQDIIITILDNKTYVRPRDILSAALSLLKFESGLQKALETQSHSNIVQSFPQVIVHLSELTLFMKLMAVTCITDLGLEAVLTDIRSALLLSSSSIPNSSDVLIFQTALALQCFTNDYIFNETKEETSALATLKLSIETTLLNGQQPTSQSILCLASYTTLQSFAWVDLLDVTKDIEDVIDRQIVEPKEEAVLKPSISVLEGITNDVSSKVRGQYEDNPYPKWVSLGLCADPLTIVKFVHNTKMMLFDQAISKVKNPDILIAGCGTGQHSIGTASQLKNAEVLAVDLSLSSLAYAIRKTKELGIKNIKYMQADILNLGKLNRQFDIIESVGVLHHMENPMAGWKVLTECLKPGGLMKIGLYSELARRDIIKIREEIDQSHLGCSEIEMKNFRKNIIDSKQEMHKKMAQFSDFYNLSELRDLLFHVQEHRFTLLNIKECLSDLGLKFCGFDLPDKVQKFKLQHSKTSDCYDLERWNSFEEANPSTFAEMYQFWCQKVDD